MYNPFSLENKVILVTGASSGIGRGIAIDTSKMGAKLTNEIDELVEKLPALDGIVLCAGIIKTMPVKNITDSAIEEIFKVNILSEIQLLSRLLRKKKLNKGASVVIISSVSTFNVKVGNSLYSATKGAANSFAKAMALEVSKQKMRVNCIQPGFVPSSILNHSGIEQDNFLRWYAERHPLGFGEPSDIANACIYLLSDAAKWVTGSIFTIDGGYTLQ